MGTMPPWDIRYELLSNIIRPMRKEWMDKAMPKYNYDREKYNIKKQRYEERKIKEENENRGKRNKKTKELDLGTLLMAPICPRFRVEVPNAMLLKCWNASCILKVLVNGKWKKMKLEIQEWLQERKSSKFHKTMV